MKKIFYLMIVLIFQQNFCTNLAYIDAVELSKKLLKDKLIKASSYWQMFGSINQFFSNEYKRLFIKEDLKKLYLFRKGKIVENEIEHEILKKYFELKARIENDINLSLPKRSKL